MVMVNGKRLDETYVPPEYRDQQSLAPQVVPPDKYFVLGTTAALPTTAGRGGMVPRGFIYGKSGFCLLAAGEDGDSCGSLAD